MVWASSPYLTPIVSVMVGSYRQEFKLHSGILSQSPVLQTQFESGFSWNPMSLPDIDPPLFELVLYYLYGGDYEGYFSPDNPVPEMADAEAATLRRHTLLYCMAHRYNLD